jgi:hypothetical protein
VRAILLLIGLAVPPHELFLAEHDLAPHKLAGEPIVLRRVGQRRRQQGMDERLGRQVLMLGDVVVDQRRRYVHLAAMAK